jgi:hypothetical protein
MKSKVSNLVKQIDLYARPINITFKGRDKFRTLYGGSISVLVSLFLISMLAYKLNVMFNREATTVRKDTLVSVSNTYSPPQNISATGNTFAFLIGINSVPSPDEYRYGKFVARQQSSYIITN